METLRNTVIHLDISLYTLYILSNKIVMHCAFFIEIFYTIISNSKANEIVTFFLYFWFYFHLFHTK